VRTRYYFVYLFFGRVRTRNTGNKALIISLMIENRENRIRIKDIAQKASVSAGTVDRVIHDRGEVAEETRKHVLSIIDELGYRPNLLAKSLATRKIFKIAALIPEAGKDNPYWEKPMFGIQQASAEIKDFNTSVQLYTFNPNSATSFLSAFSEIVESKPDGLVFTPIFFKEAYEVVRICEEMKIPFIFIDTKLEACNNLAYFGQNAGQSGFIAGKLMHYSLAQHDGILIIKPNNREGVSHHLQWREKGFLSFFLSDANTKEISTYSVEADINNKKKLFRNIDIVFTSYPGIKGIFVTNSRAFKVGHYLHEKNKNNILLIGYDLIRENLEFLEQGVINFLIGQKPEEQGYKSIQAMFNYLVTGKPIDKTNYSPIDIIMKENIDNYKNYKF